MHRIRSPISRPAARPGQCGGVAWLTVYILNSLRHIIAMPGKGSPSERPNRTPAPMLTSSTANSAAGRRRRNIRIGSLTAGLSIALTF